MVRHSEMQSFPTSGFIRQSELLTYLAFSASTLWRKVKQGTFPAPVKLSERVTAWKAEDITRWVSSLNNAV